MLAALHKRHGMVLSPRTKLTAVSVLPVKMKMKVRVKVRGRWDGSLEQVGCVALMNMM